MRGVQPESVFSLVHQPWNRVPAIRLGDAIVLRRLRGGAAESWRLELQPGGGVTSHGISAEGIVSVLSGRLRCFVFGNEVELPAGHFLVLPPNTPFMLRTGGRTAADVLIQVAHLLPHAAPLEAI